MMYIAIFPIAISMRASNTYEERSLGIYEGEKNLDESNGRDYFMTHMRNQLSFDLWFIFLGVFCICIAESERIVDNNIPVRRRPPPRTEACKHAARRQVREAKLR